MLKLPVYLDNSATTPCDERVVEAMLPYFTTQFGNAASRSHPYGWAAEEAVDIAREQVARLIGADPKEIIFTSGATEADNLAIKGAYELYASRGNHIITVATEHKAVLDTCKHIEHLGGQVTILPVAEDGLVDLDALEAAFTTATILVAVMYANNETGVLQPIQAISEIAHKHGAFFFTDAVQAAGKMVLDVIEDGIDLMSITAHKMFGPKGVGALYVRRKNPRVKLAAQMDGGGHEKGLRSGTLNVPGIVGFGKAAELSFHQMSEEALRLSALRNKLESALLGLGTTSVNGSLAHRLPHISNIAFQHIDGEAMIMGINKDIALSSGSACTSASINPSHVLTAMGLSEALAHSSLRFSLGRFTTDADIDFTIERVSSAYKKLAALNQVWKS